MGRHAHVLVNAGRWQSSRRRTIPTGCLNFCKLPPKLGNRCSISNLVRWGIVPSQGVLLRDDPSSVGVVQYHQYSLDVGFHSRCRVSSPTRLQAPPDQPDVMVGSGVGHTGRASSTRSVRFLSPNQKIRKAVVSTKTASYTERAARSSATPRCSVRQPGRTRAGRDLVSQPQGRLVCHRPKHSPRTGGFASVQRFSVLAVSG